MGHLVVPRDFCFWNALFATRAYFCPFGFAAVRQTLGCSSDVDRHHLGRNEQCLVFSKVHAQCIGGNAASHLAKSRITDEKASYPSGHTGSTDIGCGQSSQYLFGALRCTSQIQSYWDFSGYVSALGGGGSCSGMDYRVTQITAPLKKTPLIYQNICGKAD